MNMSSKLELIKVTFNFSITLKNCIGIHDFMLSFSFINLLTFSKTSFIKVNKFKLRLRGLNSNTFSKYYWLLTKSNFYNVYILNTYISTSMT